MKEIVILPFVSSLKRLLDILRGENKKNWWKIDFLMKKLPNKNAILL